MASTENVNTNRLLFFDNVRYLIVFMVVAFHTSLSYCNLTPWWWAVDSNKSKILDNMVLINDIYMMPVMFFVAGFFTLASLQKKGSIDFLKGKFRRLGIPWILGVLFIGPILTYIQHYTRYLSDNLSPMGYGSFWSQYIQTAFEFPLGAYSRSAGQFSQHQFWFLSQLLFFFMIFCAVYELVRKFAGNTMHQKDSTPPTNSSIFLSLSVFWCAVFVGHFILSEFFTDSQYITVFHLLQFRPFLFYTTLCYFVFGVFVFSKGWFTYGLNMGKMSIWVPVSIVLSIIYINYILNLLTDPSPGQGFLLFHTFIRSFLGLSLLVVITTFTSIFMNKPVGINNKLSDSSFNIYIIHSMFVVPLVLLLLPWSAPVLIKFGIVTIVSIALSFGVSNYLMKPYPRLSVAVLITLFVLMVLGINPS